MLEAIDFANVTFDVIVVEADGGNPEKDQAVRDFLVKQGFRNDGHVLRNDWFVRGDFIPSTPTSQVEVE